MPTPCSHADAIQPVPPPLEVCEACIKIGSDWFHLRQCLTCGQTLCCDESPNRHMTGHWHEVGHPIMRNASEGGDWTWCYPDDGMIREAAGGGWETFDPFLEAGTAIAAEHLATGGSLGDPDLVTDDEFPLGEWVGYVRSLRESGNLEPAAAAAIEALPGWSW